MQSAVSYWLGFSAITRREIAKFIRQTERLISAIVRPALWLIVFAAGLHDILGVSIIPPYTTYVPYQEYVLPGLIGIVILFQCMQSALSMVYDREAGVMRSMSRSCNVTPRPRSAHQAAISPPMTPAPMTCTRAKLGFSLPRSPCFLSDSDRKNTRRRLREVSDPSSGTKRPASPSVIARQLSPCCSNKSISA